MKVAVVHNAPVKGKPDSEDVLAEVELVTSSLKHIGHEFGVFPLHGGNGLSASEAVFHLFINLRKFSPDVVFNLIEEGNISDYPVLFEHFDYSFTGSGYEAMLTTTNKVLSKLIMGSFGIPTPHYQVYRGVREKLRVPPPWIIKPSMEDASVGIGDHSIFDDEKDIQAALPEYHAKHGRQPVIIEQFIGGREFNVSVIEADGGKAVVLPVAEMVFRDWPEGKPKIVGYRAKWESGSFEFNNTVRSFNSSDAPLRLLGDLAHRCFHVFGLRGYGRVDIRLDGEDRPYVLEVNANPCISGDSGFIAALKEGGLSEADFMRHVIEAALGK